jgi:hypothetical protein
MPVMFSCTSCEKPRTGIGEDEVEEEGTASEQAIARSAVGLQGVSDNLHVDAPLFCAAWRFGSIFSSQWQVEIIQSTRDADISFGK